MSKFTIITNTIRRKLDLVEKSLHQSLSQDPSIDVVLVDQNDFPLKLSSDIVNHASFQHQHTQVPAVSMARNKARYASDCEWIIFCDDDGYLESGYFQKLQLFIQSHPDVDVISGSIKRIDNGEFYSKRHAIGGNMKWFWNTKLLMGSNFVIRRSVFEELGKFDERLGAGAVYGSSEETDLAWNAFFHGKKMMYAPELVVFHVPPFVTDAGTEWKKAFRYGIGKGALVRKWLFKGHIQVLMEFFEMIVLPLIRTPILLIQSRAKEALSQFAALFGRICGMFLVRRAR